jgi:IS30 family transposase
LSHRGEKYKKRNINARKVWKEAKTRKLIDERPAVVSEKSEIGHWEGDTVESKEHQGGIGTFVDMKSKYLIIRKVSDKSSLEMKNAVVGAFEHYSAMNYKTPKEVLYKNLLSGNSYFNILKAVS